MSEVVFSRKPLTPKQVQHVRREMVRELHSVSIANRSEGVFVAQLFEHCQEHKNVSEDDMGSLREIWDKMFGDDGKSGK